ncbi:MAG TPA: hypothetical protein VKE96_01495 [Vicinamibacterales bacterium]|nr:hypothetical protein [Vicinamibacterales bacterium]
MARQFYNDIATRHHTAQQAANRRKTCLYDVRVGALSLLHRRRARHLLRPCGWRICASTDALGRQVNLEEGFRSARIAALKEMAFQGRTA